MKICLKLRIHFRTVTLYCTIQILEITMEKEVDTVRLRENLAHYLNRAAYGKEEIIITRRNDPICALVPLKNIEKDKKIK